MTTKKPKINLDIVCRAIKAYYRAYALLNKVEKLIEPVLEQHELELMFREDTFEPIWDTCSKDELMRFPVHDRYQKTDWCGYLIIKKDGTIEIEEETFEDE